MLKFILGAIIVTIAVGLISFFGPLVLYLAIAGALFWFLSLFLPNFLALIAAIIIMIVVASKS